jgi:hypothetical protein
LSPPFGKNIKPLSANMASLGPLAIGGRNCRYPLGISRERGARGPQSHLIGHKAPPSSNKAETKRKGFSIDETGVLFNDLIEDMLSGLEGIELDPRDAMCVSEIVAAVNVKRKDDGEELVALPPAIHLQIHRYAEQGMYHGMGCKYPRRQSLLDKKFVDLMIDMATERKEELEKSGTLRNKLDASLEAAEEIAAKMRAHGFKRRAETVLREMSMRR